MPIIYSVGSALAAHELHLECRWDARELTMIYVWDEHGLPMGCPRVTHGLPVDCPAEGQCTSHRLPMD